MDCAAVGIDRGAAAQASLHGRTREFVICNAEMCELRVAGSLRGLDDVVDDMPENLPCDRERERSQADSLGAEQDRV